MENNPGSTGPSEPGLGPRPSRAEGHGPRLSTSRATLLDTLAGQPEPTSLAALSGATGLHANTLREHLAALVQQGLVRRRRAEPTGRGRPVWLYEAAEDAVGSGRSEYAGLAATLASVIRRTSDSPREDAILAGVEWGRELARSARKPMQGNVPATYRVVDLLEEIGFAPAYDEKRSVVHLTRCPLLEAARMYPDVVCGVHLGIVRGALQDYGADPAGSDLFPFSEPGACRLDLGTTSEA